MSAVAIITPNYDNLVDLELATWFHNHHVVIIISDTILASVEDLES